jgi:hypothetical protein
MTISREEKIGVLRKLSLDYSAHSLVLKSSPDSAFWSTVRFCSRAHSFDCCASTVGSPSLDIPAPAPSPPGFFPSLTSTPGTGSPRSVIAVPIA